MMRVAKRILASVIAVLLLLGLVGPPPTAVAKSGQVVTNKSVEPTEMLIGGEAEVTLSIQGSPPGSVIMPNDVILVIDRSGSMGTSYDGQTRMAAAITAAQGFVDLMDFSKHRVGVVDYASDVNTFDLTDDPAAAKAYLGTLRASGSTATGDAVYAAIAALENHRPDAQPVIVIMTDGEANIGSPNGFEYAKQAAQAAKDQGIIFYTIAMLDPNADPDTAAPNLVLKEMATTAQHHHFIHGTIGLAEIYERIIREIGIASAYDVTVTDVVSPDFEIVPGSYDHNIPRPTVEGNTLTWHFLELKDDTLTFTYRIRHKEGEGRTGQVPVASSSMINYLNYAGSRITSSIKSPYLWVRYPAPVITSITPDNGQTAGGEVVTIKGEHFRPGFTVYFGSRQGINAQLVAPDEIQVTTPEGSVGTVAVKVRNDDGQEAVGSFRYWIDPEIVGVKPQEGPETGGTSVVISGYHFQGGVEVTFNGVAGTVTKVTSNAITVTTPPGAVGPADIVVTNPDGTSAAAPGAFTYTSVAMELERIEPAVGPFEGGNYVYFYGKNFEPSATVYFGDQATTIYNFYDSTSFRVKAPAAQAPGPVDVKVISPSGREVSLPQAYEYEPPFVPAPTLTKLNPDTGLTDGGYPVDLVGTHLSPDARVIFGGVEVPLERYFNENQIRVIAPAAAQAGQVDVEVINPDGQSAVATFTYEAPPPLPAPVIDSLSPDTGDVAGGYAVDFWGANFDPGAKVIWDGVELPIYTFYGAHRVRIIAPAAAADGVIEAVLINPDGQQASAYFTYELPPPPPAPVLSSLTPETGLTTGGTTVDIYGENFQPGIEVWFGIEQAQVYTFYGATRVRVISPAGAPGPVDVRVENPDGQGAILPGAFTYTVLQPTVTEVIPGEVYEGDAITLHVLGTNLTVDTEVYIGATKAQMINYWGSQQIRVTAPPLPAGIYDIRVVNPDGAEFTAPGLFEVLVRPPMPAPEMTSMSPTSGTIRGNTSVYIYGANIDLNAVVRFGDIEVPLVQWYNEGRIRVRSPKVTEPGPVEVRIVNPDGQVSNPMTFTYK